jgi:hypothetical protein
MFALRVACVGLLLLTACASSSKSVSPAREARGPVQSQPKQEVVSYGFHPEDPVRVGWGNPGIMAFFELLRGPQGQRVAWRRVGPCCEAGPSAPSAALEVFEVTYEGLDRPVRLYLDPHNGAAIHAPSGFIIEGLTSRARMPAEEQPEVIEL